MAWQISIQMDAQACGQILSQLENDIFPWLGSKPISTINVPELLTTLRRIEARGAIETAHRSNQICGQVFIYAIGTGRAERNPAADLRGVLPPVKKKNFATITDKKEIGKLLRCIDSYEGFFPTRCALQLAPLLFVRPGELQKAEWREFDLDNALWKIPAEKMNWRPIMANGWTLERRKRQSKLIHQWKQVYRMILLPQLAHPR